MTPGDERARIAETHRQIELVPCDECGAEGARDGMPGLRCRTPAGKTARVPHFPRRERAIKEGTWTPS